MPIGRFNPSFCSIWLSSVAAKYTSFPDSTFGTMMVSRYSPAPSITVMMSS